MADWHEHDEAVTGALIILGGMLFEWGLPLDKAIKGLRMAYELEAAKQVKACTCRDGRDKELCKDKDRCAEVCTFIASMNTTSTTTRKS